ncbi:RraA family protein [Streptomyces sp. NPDC001658]
MTAEPSQLAALAPRLPGTVPADRIAAVSVRRHASSLVAPLLAVPDLCSAVADTLDELGTGSVVPGHVLNRTAGGGPVCGPAITLRYVAVGGDVSANRAAGRGLLVGDRDLYGLAQPGDIAVMDASAAHGTAVLGGLSARWATLAGLAGCVVDGTVRDTGTLREVGLPVWSAGRNPACGRYRIEAVELNGSVSLFGCLVRPGDYLVADDDGVCVIPHDDVPTVVERCLSSAEAEHELTALLASGRSVEEVVGILRGRRTPA